MSKYKSFWISAQETNPVHASEVNTSSWTMKTGGFSAVGSWDAGSSSYLFEFDSSAIGTYAIFTNAVTSKDIQMETIDYLATDFNFEDGTANIDIAGLKVDSTYEATDILQTVTPGASPYDLVNNRGIVEALTDNILSGGGTNYLTAETTLWGALSALDTQVKTNANSITAVNFANIPNGSTTCISTFNIAQSRTDYKMRGKWIQVPSAGILSYEAEGYWGLSNVTVCPSWSDTAVFTVDVDSIGKKIIALEYSGGNAMAVADNPRLFIRLRATDAAGDVSSWFESYGDYAYMKASSQQEVIDAVIQQLRSRNEIVNSAGDTFQIKAQEVYTPS